MRKILVIGAGAMGAAFTFPLVDNNHNKNYNNYNIKPYASW